MGNTDIYAPPINACSEMKYDQNENNFSYDNDIKHMLNNSIAHSDINLARSYNKRLQTICFLSRITDGNARQIWLHASLQSDDNMQKVDNCEEFAYLYDLY